MKVYIYHNKEYENLNAFVKGKMEGIRFAVKVKGRYYNSTYCHGKHIMHCPSPNNGGNFIRERKKEMRSYEIPDIIDFKTNLDAIKESLRRCYPEELI